MIDAYVAALAARVRVPRRHRERILGEVREHLDDAAARLVAQGLSRSAAEQRAVESFGLAGALAEQFNHQSAATTTRRMPMLLAGCGAGVVGGFLGAAIPQPASSTAAPLPRQVAFFLGILGLQLAVIAGLRVSARVAAHWVDGPTAADARLVRHAAAVFLVGLTMTVAGWGAALLDVAGGRSGDRLVPLLAGLAAMLIGATVAAIFGLRRMSIVAGATGHQRVTDRTVLTLGERLFEWTSGHPVLSCAFVAAAAGATAMMHAETTVSGALPWGVAQGAAVVGGYLLLGPTLELRA